MVLAHEMAHKQAGHLELILQDPALGLATTQPAGGPRDGLQDSAANLALAEACQAHFSRAMEEEADSLAVQYLEKAGYDPQGLLGVLLMIEKASPATLHRAPTKLSNHRLVMVRSAWLEQRLRLPPGGSYRPVGNAAWDRGQAFSHARTGKPAEALRRFTARSASGMPIDRNLLGVVLLEMGDYRQAAEDLQIAVNGDGRVALFQSDL